MSNVKNNGLTNEMVLVLSELSVSAKRQAVKTMIESSDEVFELVGMLREFRNVFEKFASDDFDDKVSDGINYVVVSSHIRQAMVLLLSTTDEAKADAKAKKESGWNR